MNEIETTLVVIASVTLLAMLVLGARAGYMLTLGRQHRYRELRTEHQKQRKRVDDMLDDGRPG